MFCGQENEDSAVTCINCGSAFPVTNHSQKMGEVSWVVTCPCCGKKYPVESETARVAVCENCDDEIDKYEISYVAPVKVAKERTLENEPEGNEPCGQPVLILTELRKKKTLIIDREVTIDREASDVEPEFFAEDLYISSPHCRIFFEGGEWKIEDLGSLNKSSVNKAELPPFFPTVIHDGYYVRLADLLFRATLKRADGCSAPEGAIQPEPTQNRMVWAIRCHVCGTLYEVDGPESRLAECPGPCRHDVIDRYEIENDVPQQVEVDRIDKKWRRA